MLDDGTVSRSWFILAITMRACVCAFRYPVSLMDMKAALEKMRGGKKVTTQQAESSFNALLLYGRDLTEAAAEVSFLEGGRDGRLVEDESERGRVKAEHAYICSVFLLDRGQKALSVVFVL